MLVEDVAVVVVVVETAKEDELVIELKVETFESEKEKV